MAEESLMNLLSHLLLHGGDLVDLLWVFLNIVHPVLQPRPASKPTLSALALPTWYTLASL